MPIWAIQKKKMKQDEAYKILCKNITQRAFLPRGQKPAHKEIISRFGICCSRIIWLRFVVEKYVSFLFNTLDFSSK